MLKRKMLLSDMENAGSGIIMSIEGGKRIIDKLDSIGIRVGAYIVKKSALLGKGPLIVSVANTEVAIGYAMAKKILVEVDRR